MTTLSARYQRRFWKEAGKREGKEEDIPKQGISKVEAKVGMGRPPRPPTPRPRAPLLATRAGAPHSLADRP